MKSQKQLKEIKFLSECILQIWLLGDSPDCCVAYVSGLKKCLEHFDAEYIIDDIKIIIQLLEDHEKLGTLPRNLEELEVIVSQYYGEKQ